MSNLDCNYIRFNKSQNDKNNILPRKKFYNINVKHQENSREYGKGV